MVNKEYDLGLTYDQEISLILINLITDPYIVKFVIKTLNAQIQNDSREFHCSLRNDISNNWNKVDSLYKKRKYDTMFMNSCVPITFPLPFTGDQWRQSQMLL